MADILNRFLGRTDINSVKLRTLSDSISRIGAEISKELSNVTAHILSMYGFDGESGLPLEGMVLSDNITAAAVAQVAEQGKPEINERIAAVNDSRKEGSIRDYKYPESVNHLGEIFSENLKILCLWRYVFLQCFHPIVKKYLESYNPKTLAVIRFLAHFHLLGSRIQEVC